MGRGYDYEPGSLFTKFQDDIVSSKLGKKSMLEAVDTHAGNSKIITANTLKNIMDDPNYSSKLRNACTFGEARTIKLTLVILKFSPSKTWKNLMRTLSLIKMMSARATTTRSLVELIITLRSFPILDLIKKKEMRSDVESHEREIKLIIKKS